MTTVQNKINELKPYVTGMNFVKDYTIVETRFNPKWIIKETTGIGFEAVNEGAGAYRFFSNEPNITIDDILEHIANIIKLNLEREEKMALLKYKAEELKEIFKSRSLEELKRLSFHIPEPELYEEEDLTLSEDDNVVDVSDEEKTKDEEHQEAEEIKEEGK